MGRIRFYWEPWEIDSFANLRDYLIRNSEKVCPTAQINNAITKERLGDETRYNFSDSVDVIVLKYDNGSGEMIVLGENFNRLSLRLDELKNVLGFRGLEMEVLEK